MAEEKKTDLIRVSMATKARLEAAGTKTQTFDDIINAAFDELADLRKQLAGKKK